MSYKIIVNEQALNTFSDRLVYALDKMAISQTKLANKINVSRQAIQYLCSQRVEKTKFAHDIADALEINVDWLVSGCGEMLLEQSLEQKLLSEQKIAPILLCEQIQAWLSDRLDKQKISEWTTVHEKFSNKCFALRLKDNSMFPRFEAKTIIIIDPEKKPNPPCFILVYKHEIHDAVFRQLIKDNSRPVLYAFNETDYRKSALSTKDNVLGCMIEAKWLVQ